MTNTALKKRVDTLEQQATLRRIGKALDDMEAADVQAVAAMVDDRYRVLTGHGIFDASAPCEPLTPQERVRRLLELVQEVEAEQQSE